MAAYTVTKSKHATLTAATVDTITVGDSSGAFSPRTFEVVNRGSDDIYARFDGTDPVGAADNTYIVRAGEALTIGRVDSNAVKLISASATPYSVTAVDASDRE